MKKYDPTCGKKQVGILHQDNALTRTALSVMFLANYNIPVLAVLTLLSIILFIDITVKEKGHAS